MQVLRDEQERFRSGQFLDQVDAGLGDGVAEVLAAVGAAGIDVQEPGESSPGGQPIRRRGDEPVRDRARLADYLVGGDLDHGDCCPGGAGHGLADEVGLADPGLALEQHDPSLARGDRDDQVVEAGELAGAADRRRPDHWLRRLPRPPTDASAQ